MSFKIILTTNEELLSSFVLLYDDKVHTNTEGCTHTQRATSSYIVDMLAKVCEYKTTIIRIQNVKFA